MQTVIIKRSIVIAGHKTSVSLEDAFRNDLKEIAHTQRTTLSGLVAHIDGARKRSNLSSAIRLFVLEYFRSQDKGTQPQLLKGEQCSLRRTQARKLWTAGKAPLMT